MFTIFEHYFLSLSNPYGYDTLYSIKHVNIIEQTTLTETNYSLQVVIVQIQV